MSTTNYSEFYSREKRVVIPLFNYHPFHGVSDIDNENLNFIDRPNTAQKLKSWLDSSEKENENDDSGSYLITGYRGMGKSSFVGKVVHSLKDEVRESESKLFAKTADCQTKKPSYRGYTLKILYGLAYFCIILVSYSWYRYLINEPICKIIQLVLLSVMSVLLVSVIYVIIYTNCKRGPKPFIHYIKINIGSEIHNERDILAILSSSIADRIKQYVRRSLIFRPSYFWVFALKTLFFSIGTILMLCIYDQTIVPLFERFRWSEEQGFVMTTFKGIYETFINNSGFWAQIVRSILCITISYVLCIKLCVPFILKVLHLCSVELENPFNIVKKLDLLIDRINCSMDENANYGIPASSVISLNFGAHRSKRYQQASVREIEYELSCIINIIQQSKLMNNRFIIVLDELDKLDALEQDTGEKDTMPSFSFEEMASSSTISQHDRQHHILMLLSRLKYFTTSTKAKFVFIAGHELYDAYLADVSDREYSISSMFNGVLNLNSFLSSKPQYKNITRMVESYLCKAIVKLNKKNIEDEFWNDGGDDSIYVLQNVSKVLRKEYTEEFSSYTREQWESVFHFLQQFITYLTLTSNGAPKKLVNQFEKYIITKKQKDKLWKYDQEVGGYVFFFGDNISDAPYYLSFGYYEREKIGFVHYIAQPIFNNIINNNSDYDDKLLVTSLFLVSHLYKHHGSGFSWRNLEYIPELMQSNKTPELRRYIKDILNIMETMDLTSIMSGIYSFKFSKSLIEEISHFCRKFEEISAIFNFSHDYFRAVKSYFYALLASYSTTKDNIRYSPEIVANIYSYIGDIQMAGEEYTEAASSFKMSSDIFKDSISDAVRNKNEDMSLLITRYMYAMLKLGLVYEKRNTVNSAYLVYNSLTNSLIQFRNVDETNFGLRTSVVYNRSEGGDDVNNIIMHEQSMPWLQCASKIQFVPEYVSEADTDNYKIWAYGSELFSNLYHYLTPEKEQILSKLTAYEDLRIAYLSILAKLFALEKQNISGITRENVELSVSEFEYMYIVTKMSAKNILATDFYRKLGDILYYKNNSYCISKKWNDILLLSAGGFHMKHKLIDFMFRYNFSKHNFMEVMNWFAGDLKYDEVDTDALISGGNTIARFTKKLRKKLEEENVDDAKVEEFEKLISHRAEQESYDINKECICRNFSNEPSCIGLPCVACMFYNKSLLAVMKIMNIKKTSASKAIEFIKIVRTKSNRGHYSTNVLMHTALTLEAMGNTMLSCAQKRDIVHLKDIRRLLANRGNGDIKDISFLDRAVLYIYAASYYYEQIAEYTSMIECLCKVLQILYCHFRLVGATLEVKKKDVLLNEELQLSDFFKEEFKRMAELVYQTKSYHIIDIKKTRQMLYSLEDKKDSFIMLGLTSVMTEFENLIYESTLISGKF